MVSFLSSLVLAGSASAATISQRQAPTSPVDKRASTCTPQAGNNAAIDDVPAIQSAIADCASGNIVIPAGSTYYINSAFNFAGCTGCTFQVEGTLKVASDLAYWEGMKAIFLMDGITGVKVYSETGSGLIDGNGQAAYDRFANDSSYARPNLFYITDSENVVIQNLHFKNPPNAFHSVTGGSSNVQYIDCRLDSASTSSNEAKNTDRWDIGTSTYVSAMGATVSNQDDCVAFKPGTNYATVTNISCTGSHGISVGSLGNSATATDTVQNVIVDGATMITSTKAAGIKLYPAGPDHGTAIVSNVTFQNFNVHDSDYAFQIQSCYSEDAEYCTDTPSTAQLSDVVVKNFSGTTSSQYAPTVANLNCPEAGTCGVTMSGMTVESADGTATYLCANTPSDLGVTCTSGASG